MCAEDGPFNTDVDGIQVVRLQSEWLLGIPGLKERKASMTVYSKSITRNYPNNHHEMKTTTKRTKH